MAKLAGDDELQPLLDLVRGGDVAARGDLIALIDRRFLRIARWLLRRQFADVRKLEETVDIMQRLSLRLYRNLERRHRHWPPDPAGFRAFVHRCLKNLLIEVRRSITGRRHVGAATNQELAIALSGEETTEAARRRADALDRLDETRQRLAGMTERDRHLFDLIVEGATVATIAAIFNVDEGTIRRRSRRLREALGQAHAGGGVR